MTISVHRSALITRSVTAASSGETLPAQSLATPQLGFHVVGC